MLVAICAGKMDGQQITLLLFFVSYFSFLLEISNGEIHQTTFNGKEITVLAYQFSPVFNYKKQRDGNYTFDGFVYELMRDAQKVIDIRYKYIFIDEAEVKRYGLIQTFLNYLDKKEVDIVPYMFDQDLNNLQHMQLISTMWIDPYAILQPFPEEESRLDVAIRPFQLMVWVGFLGSTVVFILVTALFIKMCGNYDQVNMHPSSIGEIIYRQTEYVLTIIACQGNVISYKSRTSFKILIGLWLLTMVVIIYAYTGVMTALLTIPKLKPIANTLEEAVAQERLITIVDNTPLSRIVLNATEGYEKKIGDQFRQDPTLLAKDILIAADNVINKKCAYPTSMAMVNYIVYQDTKAQGRCRLTISDELEAYNQLPFQMGFPIGNPIASAFDEFFLRMNSVGMFDLYKKNYLPVTKECRTDRPPETKTRTLTLFDLTFAFLILGIGLSLSFLVFLLEKIFFKRGN